MTVWAPRLAKLRVPGAGKASGWAIGATGVLTVRDAITAILPDPRRPDDTETQRRETAEVIIGADPSTPFECTVLWDSESVNLAILQVSPLQRGAWRDLLAREPDPTLTSPGTEPVAGSCVIGFDDRATKTKTESNYSWMLSQPLEAQGMLRPDVMHTDHATFNIETSFTDKAARRLMAGAAALRYRPEPILLGLTTGRSRGRKHFYVSTLPDPANDPSIATALRRVGVPPVVHCIDGPTLRTFLRDRSVDPAGRPRRLRSIDDPGWFGTRRARTDVTPPDEPYFPFVERPEAAALRSAIDAALDGTGPRCLVVAGAAEYGKSRLTAEVLTHHPRLTDHYVLAPDFDRRIEDLPIALRRGPVLVWLDEMGDYPATSLSQQGVRRLIADNREAIIVGTYTRTNPPVLEDGDLPPSLDMTGAVETLSGVHAVLDDPTITTVIDLAAVFDVDRPDPSADGTIAHGDTPDPDPTSDSSALLETVLTEARTAHVSLGEYLSAHQEAGEYYAVLSGPARILVDLVSEWDRSGVCADLDADTARTLWARCAPLRLSQREAREFARMSDSAFTEQWLAAIDAATRPILGSSSLVIHTSTGFASTSVGRQQSSTVPINTQVWDYILKQFPSTPPARLTMGIRALEAGTPQRALRAFESILFFRDDGSADPSVNALVDVIARRGIALYLTQLGQTDRAISVYTDLVDSVRRNDDPAVRTHIAQAFLGIAGLFQEVGSDGQAISAYGELDEHYGSDDDPWVRRYVAVGLLAQANALERADRNDETAAIYQEIAKRYARDKDPGVRDVVEISQNLAQQ